MTRTVWITHEEWPTSAEVLAQAIAAGATEVLHGVPAALADRVPADAVGLVELEEPELGLPIADPEPVTVDPVAMLVSALRDPLANLTPSSASTTVRTAILNQRAALDALLGQLETP